MNPWAIVIAIVGLLCIVVGVKDAQGNVLAAITGGSSSVGSNTNPADPSNGGVNNWAGPGTSNTNPGLFPSIVNPAIGQTYQSNGSSFAYQNGYNGAGWYQTSPLAPQTTP